MAILSNQRGATLVFVALFLIILLLFVGLAIDIGWTTYVKNQGQGRVDSAALAAAVALVSSDPAKREADANALANAFSDQNLVVNPSVDPTNMVEPMSYDLTTNTLAVAPNWTPQNANAVRVTNIVPTPLFLSGVRAVFGGAETCTNTDGSPGQNCTDVPVGAVGYLGCPGEVYTNKLVPIALRACKVYYPDDCDVDKLILSPEPDDNGAFTTFNLNGANVCRQAVEGNPPSSLDNKISCGDMINLVGSGEVTSCLTALKNKYGDCTAAICSNPDDSLYDFCTVHIPIVDTGCPGYMSNCLGPASNNMARGKVVGFGSICFTNIVALPASQARIDVTLECEGQIVTGSPTGECFGTFTQNPVLVR